jgi:hypothetical protein
MTLLLVAAGHADAAPPQDPLPPASLPHGRASAPAPLLQVEDHPQERPVVKVRKKSGKSLPQGSKPPHKPED